ncbi:type I glyceraldehyde-3-phosphate dehydrogenase [Patescibacteria group bacterium]
MKKTRIAINGFGRVGRIALRIARKNKNIEVVAINNTSSVDTMANLLKYDSVYGRYDEAVNYDLDQDILLIGQDEISVTHERQPEKLPWADKKIDVVLECTGAFVKDRAAEAHLKAGAKAVVLSAPPKGTGDVPTYVIGVNEDNYQGDKLVSNASCTTNCVATVAGIINRAFGFKKGFMTTIHSYTSDQNLLDNSHKDLRRARAAAINIIPTSSGAAISTTETIPEIAGKFDGYAVRVPTPVVSLSDFTVLVGRQVSKEEVNEAFSKKAADPNYSHLLAVTSEPVVSSDLIGDPHSAIVDLSLTEVVDGDLIHVVAWYDNEWGYSTRLVELAEKVVKKVK